MTPFLDPVNEISDPDVLLTGYGSLLDHVKVIGSLAYVFCAHDSAVLVLCGLGGAIHHETLVYHLLNMITYYEMF